MNELEVKRVPFMGTDLMAAKDESGTIWAGVSYICNGLGLNKNEKDRQIKNVQSDEVLKEGCVKFDAGVFDPNNPTIAVKLDFVPLWLAKISITPNMKAERPELAKVLKAYQLKAKDVLAAAFLPKKARGGESKPMTDYQQMMAETRRRNAQIQEARIYTELAKRYKGTTYEQVLNAHATKSLSGEYLLPLPEAGERLMSAGEVGAKLGISSNLVGKLANKHGLKTDQYGKWMHDKSPYSNKEVPSFRYKECVVDKLREILAEI